MHPTPNISDVLRKQPSLRKRIDELWSIHLWRRQQAELGCTTLSPTAIASTPLSQAKLLAEHIAKDNEM